MKLTARPAPSTAPEPETTYERYMDEPSRGNRSLEQRLRMLEREIERLNRELERLREQIEAVDEELVALIGRRLDLVLEVGRIKEALGLPVMDPPREAKVVRRVAAMARRKGVDEELTRDVVWRIIASARDAQAGRTSWGPGPPDAELDEDEREEAPRR